MQRREWFKLLTGGFTLAAWRSAGSAEIVRKIGLLIINAGYENEWDALLKRLAGLGWEDGKNIKIIYKYAQNDMSKIPQQAQELVAEKVELIAAQSTIGALIASKVVGGLPIVGVGMFDPIASGAVTNLAKPGGYITGTSYLANDITLKTLELVRLVLPEAKNIAILINPNGTMRNYLVDLFDQQSPSLGFQNTNFFAGTESEITDAFGKMAVGQFDATVICQNPFYAQQRLQLADLGIRHKLPTFAQWGRYVEDGVLASYGNDITATYPETAKFIDQILRGGSIANMPIEQSSTFEMAINLKTADKLGVTISSELQLRANKLIQ